MGGEIAAVLITGMVAIAVFWLWIFNVTLGVM
jgi:hypothetical protein